MPHEIPLKLSKQALDLLTIRLATKLDKGFVLDAWLNGYRRSKYAGTVPNNLFDRVYSTAIQQLLDRGMEILVLTAREDLDIDEKLGFIAFELSEAKIPVIHWLYVKEEFRGRKLANLLLAKASVSPSDGFLYTHRTAYSRYFRKARYAPAIARRKELEPVRPVTKDHNGKNSPKVQENPA